MMGQGKKLLHILKNEPDDLQRKLISDLSTGNECLSFPLFGEEEADYEELIDRIFEYDQVVTWW